MLDPPGGLAVVEPEPTAHGPLGPDSQLPVDRHDKNVHLAPPAPFLESVDADGRRQQTAFDACFLVGFVHSGFGGAVAGVDQSLGNGEIFAAAGGNQKHLDGVIRDLIGDRAGLVEPVPHAADFPGMP